MSKLDATGKYFSLKAYLNPAGASSKMLVIFLLVLYKLIVHYIKWILSYFTYLMLQALLQCKILEKSSSLTLQGGGELLLNFFET